MKVVKSKKEVALEEPIKVGNTYVQEEKKLTKKQEVEQEELKKELWRRKKVRMKLLFTAIVFCVTLYLVGCDLWISLIPFYVHIFLSFYTYAVHHYKERRKKIYWRKYMKKYGKFNRKNGKFEIPRHVQMTHKKLIKEGKKIKV